MLLKVNGPLLSFEFWLHIRDYCPTYISKHLVKWSPAELHGSSLMQFSLKCLKITRPYVDSCTYIIQNVYNNVQTQCCAQLDLYIFKVLQMCNINTHISLTVFPPITVRRLWPKLSQARLPGTRWASAKKGEFTWLCAHLTIHKT